MEVQAREIEVLGTCDNTYPLQKKGHSMEFLREIAHSVSYTHLDVYKRQPHQWVRILLRKTRRLNPLLTSGFGFCSAKQGV